MDLLDLIKEKIKVFLDTEQLQGLESVIHHIEISEKHFTKAKNSGDDYLFTDVIYRTNHAFEGILKEAYAILTGKDPSRITPFKIEKYLDENKILKDRVLNLFTNYRTEWRNKSTHDYQLFFTEQEAFLAVVTICAFINIMLDQMIERSAYEKEKAKTDLVSSSIKSSISDYDDISLFEQAIQLLMKFSSELISKNRDVEKFREVEAIGMLSAFINSVDPDIDLKTEVRLPFPNKMLIADLVLEKSDEKVIIELKRSGFKGVGLQAGEDQLFTYLSAAKIRKGVLFFLPSGDATKMQEKILTRQIGKIKQEICRIYPYEAAAPTKG